MTRVNVLQTLVFLAIIYTGIIYTRGTPPSPGQLEFTASVKRGRQLFQQKNCIACHQFYGLGGYMGPDLTNVVSVKGKDYPRPFLQYGTAKMPNFNLSDGEISDLIAYLEFVDSSGISPPQDYRTTWYGTTEGGSSRKQ